MPRLLGGFPALAFIIAVSIGAPAWATGITERVSIGKHGRQGNDGSFGPPAFSADGRFVAFDSYATNLVAGDTNTGSDVFVRDRKTGTTERVSVGPGGVQGNGSTGSFGSKISAGGRFVAFTSDATNLVSGDNNFQSDVFVRDRRTGATERVSVGSSGVEGDQFSGGPAMSADGRFVAFTSYATNLISGATNGFSGIYVRDRKTDSTRRVCLGSGGVQGDSDIGSMAISPNGRWVAFSSAATNLVAGDNNGDVDVFVCDRTRRGTTRLVSVGPGGVQGFGASFGPSISANGRFIAFESTAANLVPGDTNDAHDVFVRDRQAGTTERLSVSTGGAEGDDLSGVPAISASGRFVAFLSYATNLVRADTNGRSDDFIRDRKRGTTRRMSLGRLGVEANGLSRDPAISADGRLVGFDSDASNLVPGDNNTHTDVFVRIVAP